MLLPSQTSYLLLRLIIFGIAVLVIASGLLHQTPPVMAQGGGTYDLSWYTIDSSDPVEGGDYKINGSVGQFDASSIQSGGQFELNGGFWHANSAPIANNDSYTITQNIVLTVSAAGVLTNDIDLEGDVLSATLQTGPVSGTLLLSSDGAFVYTPTTNFTGNDYFTYIASDGTLTDTAIVTITVLANQCWVETTGDNVTDFANIDATAVRDALNAASSGDTIKVAGYCAGVDAATSAVITISNSLTVTGGYTHTDWLTYQPTVYTPTLDALSAGRVITISSGPVLLENLTVTNGRTTGANDDGAGIYNTGGSLTISGTTVYSNVASGSAASGGGIFSSQPLTLINSAILSNTATASGGGVIVDETITLTNSRVLHNSAQDGGGLYISGNAVGNSRIVNSLLAGNSATNQGQALYLSHNGGDDTTTLIHTTIASATVGSGQAVYLNAGTANITNTIIASHTTGLEVNTGATLNTNYNLYFGNGVDFGGGGTINPATVEILGDPAFADPGSDDYQLTAASYAINRGTDAGLTDDYFGNVRPGGGGFDIGYHETTLAAEMLVLGNGQAISNGDLTPDTADDTDYGLMTINYGLTHTFTISNNGTANLNLISSPAVTLTSGTAFTVTQPTSTTLASGETTTFNLAFVPPTVGNFTDTVTIANSDPDESPYTFVVSGTGIVPTIEFSQTTYTYNEDGTAVGASVTLTRSPSDGPSSVQVNFADDTATGGSSPLVYPEDFDNTTQTITFNDGQISQTVVITINDDTVDEVSETLTMTLSTPVTATIGGNSSTGLSIIDNDAPPTVTLTLGGSPLAEAGGTATVTATLSAVSGKPVTITLSYSGSATNLSDYTRSDTEIVIPAGSLSGTVTLTAVQDTLDEPDETVIVDISSVTNGTEDGVQQMTATITDDDDPPTVTLTLGGSPLAEASGTATVTATLSAVSGKPVTITLSYSGSATNLSDYTHSDTEIVIPAGSLSGTVTLTTVQDTLDEPDETVVVDISSVTNGTEVGTEQVTATITDDDDPPTVTLTLGGSPLAEASGTATVTATLSAVSGKAVTITLGYSGSATNLSDYTRSDTEIVIPTGSLSGTVTLTVVQDLLDEPDETVIVDISSITNGTEVGIEQVTAIITDDDDPPTVTLTLGGSPLAEASGTATVTATLSAVSGKPVTITLNYSGSATNLSDYTRSDTEIVISAGSLSGTVVLTAVQDLLDEPDETVIVDISSVTNGTEIGTEQVTATITDDDDPPTVTLTLGGSPLAEASGTATVTATLSAVSGKPVTITLSYSGSATNLSDYTRSDTEIVIPAGSLSGTVVLTAVQDLLDEPDETVIVDISSVTNGTEVGTEQVTAIITDDDDPPTVTLTLGGSPLAEASGTATVTTTLSAVSGKPVTITLSYSGSATNLSDYTRSDTEIVIPAGSLSGTMVLTAVQDLLDEPDETIIVDISSVTNGTEDDVQQVTATITDDDDPPTVTLTLGGSPLVEASGTATVTATLSAVSGKPVTITLGYNGSATNLSDYTRSDTEIVIPAGSLSGTVVLTAVQDTLDEPDETITVDISSVTNGTEVGTEQVTATITDDDAPPTVTLTLEGSPLAEASGTATVTATLSAVSGKPVTITLSYSGSATNLSDYTRSDTEIVISAGSLSGTVVLTAVQDTLDEPDETVIVDISSVTNGTEVGTEQVTATISDDDDPPTVTLTLGGSPLAEASGTATVTATLSAVSGKSVTITLGYSGSATNLSDYTRSDTEIVIPAGSLSGTVTLTTVQDLLDEPDETVIVDISSVTNGTEVGTEQVTATISDDDDPPTVTLTLGGSPLAEASGTATVTATLSAVSGKSVTITLGYSGSATNLSDYTRSDTEIVIPAGSLSGTVTLTTVQDLLDEPDETVIVDISSVTNGTEDGVQQVTATITDDDFNLVINEIDYDQPGTDTAEFIELKNIGTNSINLDDYTVELVEGSGGSAVVYDTIDLPNVNLAAGDYYVICGDSATVANCDLDVTPSSDLIQNDAPDAIGLRLSGTLKDAVSYEGDSGVPYVEGSGVGLEDVVTDAIADKDKGLSRYPDGTDTNQNNVDFSLRCITPGTANTNDNSQCGAPVIEFTLAGYQVNEDGTAVGSSITLTRTGKITNASEVQVSFSDGTATGSGVDYTSDPITVTFPAGNAGSQTVTVPVAQDFLNEPAEILTMTLTAVTNAFIGTQVTATLTIVDDDIPAVLVSLTSGLTTTEAGGTDTFQLVLQSQPTSVVTVTVVSTDTGEGLASPAAITFTSLTWNEVQTVTVTGQDDTVDDGDQSYTIETTAQSSDSDYNGISVADVSITNLDDDARGVTVTPTNVTVTEGGVTDTYTVVLDSQPTADVSVIVSSGPQLEVRSTSPIYNPFITLTFTTLNWNEAQTVTVQAIDDATVEGDHSGVITHAISGGDYNSESASDVTVRITDNDQTFALVANQASVTEGDTGSTGLSFTVTRSGAVTTTTGSVDFSLGGTTSSGTDYNSVAPVSGTVTFAPGQIQQPITLGVLGDFLVEANETIVLTLTNPIGPGEAILTTISAQTVISDDDIAGFTIAPTSGLTTTEIGGTANFSVWLNTQPTANVTVTLTSSNSSEGTVSPITLVFSPLTWQTAQTVTVAGQDDALADGDVAYIIQTNVESDDSNYNSLDPDDVALINLDDDTPGFEINPTSLTIEKPNDSATFTINLTSQPTATVTINLSSSDTDICTVSPTSVTLDALNWHSGVTVTVTAVDDGITDEAQLCNVFTSAASSSDPNYNNLDVPDVSVTVGGVQYLYLPLIAKRLVFEPDLVIMDIQATSTDVTITIVNTGTAAVVDAFWIDVYFDLDTPPDVNQPWPTTAASHGVVWGLAETDLPIMPGESRTLTLADAIRFFEGQQITSDPPYPAGVTVYGYVDSVSLGSSVAAVAESDESNNLFGPITSGASGPTGLMVKPNQSQNDEPMPSR